MKGSRRLMARIAEERRVKQINRTYRPPPPHEQALRAKLNHEARTGWRDDRTPGLVKQAPKALS